MRVEEEIMEKSGYMYNRKTDQAWAALQKGIDREEKSGLFVKQSNPFPFILKIAAVFIILLALGWGIRQWIKTRQHVVQTTWNQEMIKLSDGSVVYLNGNSKLSYPDKFSAKTRVVTLRGEAFFTISKDPGKSFVVKTKAAQIKVFGTSFNVNAPDGQSKVEVLVETGVVGLSTRKDPANPVILHPGEFGVLNADNISKSAVKRINYLSWRTKTFYFQQDKLSTVVSELGRAYAKNIELKADSLQNLQLTSTYKHVDLDAILESICLTFHLKQEKSGDRIILQSIN